MNIILFCAAALGIYGLLRRLARTQTAKTCTAEPETITDIRERDRIAKAVEKRNKQVEKAHQQIYTADNEIAFQREQVERIWQLLQCERDALEAAETGTEAWKKCQSKVIARENQLHAVQSKIDKQKLIKANAKKVIA